ncbi:hypothetical protein HK097_010527 [Rhizophlyctis rosea]|uniref:Uncharacterized protein n=1 Tax=Rhizophlyctis rosea TaxID=64517 RepID=A0AAD5X2G9_9FUNG|nr:hypothetical protein HK097_010527 [Rhizophlyctis rosea]
MFLIGPLTSFTSHPPTRLAILKCHEAGAVLVHAPSLEPLRDGNYAQLIRLAAGVVPTVSNIDISIFQNEIGVVLPEPPRRFPIPPPHSNPYIILTDSDIIPLSPSYFHPTRINYTNPSHLTIFEATNYGPNDAALHMRHRYPMTNMGGSQSLWREVVGVDVPGFVGSEKGEYTYGVESVEKVLVEIMVQNLDMGGVEAPEGVVGNVRGKMFGDFEPFIRKIPSWKLFTFDEFTITKLLKSWRGWPSPQSPSSPPPSPSTPNPDATPATTTFLTRTTSRDRIAKYHYDRKWHQIVRTCTLPEGLLDAHVKGLSKGWIGWRGVRCLVCGGLHSSIAVG